MVKQRLNNQSFTTRMDDKNDMPAPFTEQAENCSVSHGAVIAHFWNELNKTPPQAKVKGIDSNQYPA
jgi:hypothetical protein